MFISNLRFSPQLRVFLVLSVSNWKKIAQKIKSREERCAHYLSCKDEKLNVLRRKCRVSRTTFCATFYDSDISLFTVFLQLPSLKIGTCRSKYFLQWIPWKWSSQNIVLIALRFFHNVLLSAFLNECWIEIYRHLNTELFLITLTDNLIKIPNNALSIDAK